MRRLVLAALAASVALTGCAQAARDAKQSAPAIAAPARVQPAAEEEEVATLPLPEIPSTITEPAKRAEYAVAHFWDAMDFADNPLSCDTAFMEQNFANFASLLPLIDLRTVLTPAAKALMSRAEVNRDAYNLLAETADKYLYDPNSPMLNEEAYIPFLEAITGSSFIDNALRARYNAQLEDVLKNRVGTRANDFDIVMHTGEKSTLLKECRGANAVIVLFYDPECSNCERLVSDMNGDGALRAAIVGGRVKIVAIYPDGDEAEFAASAGKIPAAWTDGMSIGGRVTEEELYSIRAMPSLYLLDGQGNVVLKDAEAGTVVGTALSM